MRPEKRTAGIGPATVAAVREWYRREHGMKGEPTNMEVANAVGVNRATLQGWADGRSPSSAEYMWLIHERTGIPYDTLFGEPDRKAAQRKHVRQLLAALIKAVGEL